MSWHQRTAVVIVALLLVGGRLFAADTTILSDGKSDYQIILPDEAPSARVAEGLQQTARLLKATFAAHGAEVPVVAEKDRDVARPGIYLGDTAFARANGVETSTFRDWGYAHKAVGRDIILAGRDMPSPVAAANPGGASYDRLGTAKAAAAFLREYAGVRFLYPDLQPRAALPSGLTIDLLTTPAIEFLPQSGIAVPGNLDVRGTTPLKYNTAWAASAGFYDIANNRFPLVDEVFGGHTWSRAIPDEDYAENHPEYFALIDGRRLTGQGGHAQYCISNPAVQELFYQDLVRWLDAGYDTVDLGQPDGFRPCQCEDCRSLFNTGDDWGEKIWILHRNLAERVLRSHPGKQVTVMSYILTAAPPKTFKKFPGNTRVMLCGTNEDDLAPWRECEVPGGFIAYVYNWCPNLGSRYTPMRTPRFVEAQAKRFVRNHLQSIYRDGPGTLYGLEGPVYYVMGRMFDDPEALAAQTLMHEFCSAAFGKSAPAMLRFYDRLYHGIELYSEYLGTRAPAWTYHDIYGRRHKHLTDPFQLLGFLYTPNLLEALEKELAQAEAAADSEKVEARLLLVRREFDYLTHLARAVHLHHAYQIQPDLPSRNRLLDAIDARNAHIASYYNERGHAKLVPGGWAFTLFPIPGHSLEHLRLAYDGYQEPFKDTCLNWDTTAMRVAALPGTRRLAVREVAGPLSLDAPAWAHAASETLKALPAGAEPVPATTMRVLRDSHHLYLRVECELPADATQDAPLQETVEFYLTPAGRDVSYRFTFGSRPESKADAARGLVDDAMDPRHEQYDPDWNGNWTCESRFDAENNHWLALLSIPFATFGVEPPVPGTIWLGNIGRVHGAAPGRVERSIWSAAAGTKTMDDRGAFGEFVFEAASETAQTR